MAIVVGYIPTKEGAAALTRAGEEALLRKTDLVVINSNRDGAGEDSEELSKLGEDLKAQGVTVTVRQLIRGNEPAEDLIAVADELDAELIVIGLRRRTPVGKLILGSNAQRILLDAPCPVLAVKS
ncbi:universal stress protein [Knoellia subterranea]|uniref:Universal stress protein UspA n=1 Tax=Knoellia subterranea KCTC 19937 TaxID=1385521 RepID=A0A0A0JKY2_9MICO|nr:universal stress protein [Knoellia subterranea]KGN36306.1 universal stress protein UspA [Knoellia subterranea KCTC 19937]